jgi:hypothetical protein
MIEYLCNGYNCALGYMPPVEFEAQLKAPNMEAAAGQRVAMSFSRHRKSFGPMQK